MTETEPKTDRIDLSGETEPTGKIDDKKIGRLFSILDGKDPDAQQTITDFLKMKSVIERTNLPDIKTVLTIAQLLGYGKLYFPNNPNDPFTLIANTLAEAYMARNGEKSKQFVDLMRNTPNMSELQTFRDLEDNKGLLDRFRGRGKTE